MKLFPSIFCWSLFVLASAMSAAVGCESPKPVALESIQSERPNIILIYADDQGWKDIGYQSEGKFKTPVLDNLAKRGMVFTDAYSNAANCQPARACLLSGNYTPRHHVFAVQSTKRGPKNQMRLIPTPNRDGLAIEDVTIADALKDAGYATGHFGKWHLYSKGGKGGGGSLPSQQGFDVTYDSFGEGELPEGAKGNHKGPTTDPKGVFDLSKQACKFMEANKEEPFFVYLAHHAPHGPLNSRKSTREKIKNPLKACVYDLDASVDLVLKKVKELGIEKNTLIIYTSDNGGTVSQEPLRGTKGCYYEGGIREPMIACWPGTIEPGSTCSVPVMQADLFPTFVSLAKAEAKKTLDGESLLPLLNQSGSLKRKSIFWHMPGYLDRPVPRGRDKTFRTRPVSVIRKDKWKLHLYLEEWTLDGGKEKIDENNAVELYDLASDVGEHHNLAQKNPETRDEILAELLTWHETAKAPIPTKPNPAFDPSAKPKKKSGKKRPKKKSAATKPAAATKPNAAKTNAANTKGKPNVIYILADDLGYGEVGYNGQKKIQTPELDALAAKGMRFTDHYCGNAVCAPSRASLVMGQHPGHAYIRANSPGYPNGQTPIPADSETIGKLMKRAGYTTACIGKWGLGGFHNSGNPNKQGFDHFFGYTDQRNAHEYYPPFLWRNGEKIKLNNSGAEQNDYSHDLLTKEAFQFIDDNQQKPFFLYLAYTIPHVKWQVPDLAQYADKDWPKNMKIQAAMVSRMDRDIGALAKRLEELGIDDNTLIVFNSDNGAHGKGGTLDFFKPSGKLRGIKRKMYDGGVRSPMIAYWPGKVPAGKVSDHISAFWDLLPTLSELTGEPLQGETDGISMLPTLLGEDSKQKQHKYLYWELYESRKPNCAIRFGKWKGVVQDTRKGLNIELYDVKADQREVKNLAEKHPEVVSQISKMMTEAHVPNPFWDKANKPLFDANAARRATGLKEGKKPKPKKKTPATKVGKSKSGSTPNQKRDKPNVVVIMADGKGKGKGKAANNEVAPTFKDVKYGSHAKQLVNFWQVDSDEPVGVLLHIHGGGWMGGKKHETQRPRELKRGFHHASISYPLVNEDAQQPAMLDSALRAVQFLRHKAKDWNIDPKRIVVAGGSAGGCSSLLVALHDDVANPKSGDPVEHFSSRVIGAAVAGAQTTMDPFVIKERIGDKTFGNPMPYKPFGAETAKELVNNWDKHKELCTRCSPIAHVSADDPPLFLFYNVDREFPASKSSNGIHSPIFGEILLEACKKEGVTCHLQYHEKDRPKPSITMQQFQDQLLTGTAK